MFLEKDIASAWRGWIGYIPRTHDVLAKDRAIYFLYRLGQNVERMTRDQLPCH